MVKQDLGLAFLGATSAFGLHSSVNPSLFTLTAFARERPEAAQTGLLIGLGAVLTLAVGLRLLYGPKANIPSIVTAATGVGLYFLSQKALADGSIKTAEEKVAIF